jgi:hypothetical protein
MVEAPEARVRFACNVVVRGGRREIRRVAAGRTTAQVVVHAGQDAAFRVSEIALSSEDWQVASSWSVLAVVGGTAAAWPGAAPEAGVSVAASAPTFCAISSHRRESADSGSSAADYAYQGLDEQVEPRSSGIGRVAIPKIWLAI